MNLFAIQRTSLSTSNDFLLRSTHVSTDLEHTIVTAMEGRRIYDRNRDHAKEKLGLREWLYFSSGGGNEKTQRCNEKAFQNISLVPKLLPYHHTNINIKTTLFGREVDLPICISPTAYHHVLHPDGELATVMAAQRMNTCYVQTSWNKKLIEDVSEAFPDVLKWLNIHFMRSVDVRGQVLEVVRLAEKRRYSALVVTVDSSKIVVKKFPSKLPPHLKQESMPVDAKAAWVTWADIRWLKSVTHLPIVLKGILTAQDALLAVDSGVAAVQVSNHGGRQRDCSLAAIEALAEISQAVSGKIDLFLDGGVRCGADVLKALALGAKVVFLGRPILYGLHYNGSDGIVEVLQSMKEQLIEAMRQTDCTDVNKIPRNIVKVKQIDISRL